MPAIKMLLYTGVALALTGPSAQAADKVIFANASPPSVSSASYAAANQLGFFAEEGLDLEFRVFPGGANSTAQTVNGGADISLPGNEPVIIGKQGGRDPLPVKFYYNATPTNIWELIVPESSPIRSIDDLKGKRIGIFAPSASNVPQVKAILRRAGINPETDVQMRSIGLGAGALNAMQTGVVDVIALYDTEDASFETMGAKIRRLPRDDMSSKLFSNGLLVREEWLEDPAKREILVKFARAYAKASLFCSTNPEACVKLTWKQFPETKPTGMSEEKAMKNGMFILSAKLNSQGLREYQNGQWGRYDPERWQVYVDFLLSEGVIKQPVDISTLFTNDLIPEINDFDHEAVVQQAKDYE